MIRAYRPRMKACRVCKTEFLAERPMQHACGMKCALALVDAKKAKAAASQAKAERVAARAAKAAARAKLKTRADYLKDAQQAFNAWVRERDHGLPCISCGRQHQGKWDAGHYLSVGAHPELRFEAANVHRQCSPCNTHLSGNIPEYRKGLLQRIGPDLLAWLEGPHEPRRYSVDELKALTIHYRAEARKLAKARSQAVAA